VGNQAVVLQDDASNVEISPAEVPAVVVEVGLRFGLHPGERELDTHPGLHRRLTAGVQQGQDEPRAQHSAQPFGPLQRLDEQLGRGHSSAQGRVAQDCGFVDGLQPGRVDDDPRWRHQEQPAVLVELGLPDERAVLAQSRLRSQVPASRYDHVHQSVALKHVHAEHPEGSAARHGGVRGQGAAYRGDTDLDGVFVL